MAFEEENNASPQELPCSKGIAECMFKDLGLGEEKSDTVWAHLQAHAERGRAGVLDAVKALVDSPE